MIHFSEADDIYFSKTKQYFKEVESSYSIGNYRSSIVVLYSVTICDLLYKLQELSELYSDKGALAILQQIEKTKTGDALSKAKWEKELIDLIQKKTELLDPQAFIELNHLYDYRNLCAHPALNLDYELYEPSREVTAACIASTLKNILVKPPIFIGGRL